MAERKLRIAATADIHYGKHSRGVLHDALAEISQSADVLLFCGDLTDYGLAEEAEELVADIRSAVRIPMLAVLGNHDFESGEAELVCKVLDGAGVNVLNGEAAEIQGVGFAGVCGFGGGFGRRMLNAWGEPLIKQFVQEAIDQAVRLEQALAKLQTDRRVAVLHYSTMSPLPCCKGPANRTGLSSYDAAEFGGHRPPLRLSVFIRINNVAPGHRHPKRTQRVQNSNRSRVRVQNFW